MEKGRGKRTDTLPTDKVFTRKEYIEREAAIDELEEWHDMYPESDVAREALSMAKRSILKIPAADVVPVVRCGECKHSAVDFENMRYCKLVTYYNHVPDDWFCADGEKRAEND